MKSALAQDASSGAQTTIWSTFPVRGIDLPELSLPAIRSLPGRVPVLCDGCGKTFDRVRSLVKDAAMKGSTRIFCSKACASAAARVEIACANCGDTFTRTKAELRKAEKNGWTTTLCSVACRSEHESKRAAASRRKCGHCGETVPHRHLRYCSEECARKNFETTLTCEQCGGEFVVKRYEAAKRERQGKPIRFCSKTCMGKSYTTRRCRQCGGNLPDRDRKYCSADCKQAALKQQRPRKLPEKVCTECGRIFPPRTSRHTYCDRYCANAAHSRRMAGEGNGRYRHGRSYNIQFKRMRHKILLRDEMKCVACKTPNRRVEVKKKTGVELRTVLVVHHINEDPKDNRPENLISLCHRCHMIHHKSKTTPFTWFAEYAEKATASMTSRWKDSVTSLLAA